MAGLKPGFGGGGGGGAVSSVAASDATITVNPTTGAVKVGAVNPAQIQSEPISTAQATLLSQLSTGTLHSTSATATAGETSILTGVAVQAIAMPAAPANGTVNTILNYSTQIWTIDATGADVIDLLSGQTGQINTTIATLNVTQFLYQSGTWYQTASSLGLSTATTAGQFLGFNTSNQYAWAFPTNTINASLYGVVAGSTAAATANRQAINALLQWAELLNCSVSLPGGAIYIDQPVVMRNSTGLVGAGGGTQQNQSALTPIAGANCSTLQYQRAMFFAGSDANTIAAFSATGTTYTTTYTQGLAWCTYGGYYWACRVGYTTSGSPNPNVDLYHWVQVCPVVTTTFNNAATTINQTPQNITVTASAPFGTYGGVMQVVVSGVAHVFSYTGISGTTLEGVTIASGSLAIAGTESIYPQDATKTSKVNLTLSGGFQNNMSPGRFDAVDMYTSASGGDFNLNVTVLGGTGDGWGSLFQPGGNGGANKPGGYSGQRYHVGCSSLYNSGTGKIANTDSSTIMDVVGANGIGGHLFTTSSSQVTGSSKSWNNGRAPLWKASRTVTGTVTSAGVLTISGGTFVADDVGQCVYDGASPGAGDIAAGTYITNISSTTVCQLAFATAPTAGSGLTVTIGGYYFWPTTTAGAVLTGVVSPLNGNYYVLKAASVVSNTGPASDPTNWQQVRLAIEWGWDTTEYGSGIGENTIQCDCQSAKMGSYNGVNSNGSLVDITANGWISNTWSWNGSSGAAVSAYTVPPGLQAAGCVNLGSSVGHNVRAAARQSVSQIATLGTLVQPGTATNCVVQMTSDSAYLSLVGATVTPSTALVINGVNVGPSAISQSTYTTGSAGLGSFCVAETVPRAAVAGSSGSFGAANSNNAVRAVAVWLPAGVTITYLGWISGSTSATLPTHQWLGLADNNRNVLATTADQLTAAIAATTAYQYQLTLSPTGGAITNYTTTYSGVYYLFICVTATTTLPTYLGNAIGAAIGGETPQLLAQSSASFAGPPGVATQFTWAGTVPGVLPYLWAA